MKRRRPDNSSSSTHQQPKISRFFGGNGSNNTKEIKNRDNNEVLADDISPSSNQTINKAVQVTVPCSLDVLGSSPEGKNVVCSKTFSKLQKFSHSEENISDGCTKSYINTSSTPYPSGGEMDVITQQTTPTEAITSLLKSKHSDVKLTPLEQQVLALKQTHPDLLLIFECGYKYQCFGEDAEEAGRVLNMTTYPKHNFLGLSFPVHRLLIHVKKLVSHGCKVGVVRQKETSALKAVSGRGNKSSLFKRELDAIYTKATFIDDEAGEKLSDTSSLDVPLCMVFVSEAYAQNNGATVQLGLLALFTQTSSVVFDYFQDNVARNGLDAKLTHWQPAEIIMPDKNMSSQTFNFVHQFSSYKSFNGDIVRMEVVAHAEQKDEFLHKLKQIYSDDEEIIKKIGSLPPVVLSCLLMAHRYLKQFKMEQLLLNFKNAQQYSDAEDTLHLDGQCVRNLNLVPMNNSPSTFGTVFATLNRTRTKLGSRLLRSWLLKPLANRERINSRQDAVEWFFKRLNDPEVVVLKKALKSLPDLDHRATAVLHGRSRPKEFYGLCRAWQQFSQVCNLFPTKFGEEMSASINYWIDMVVESLNQVPDYLAQLNEGAVDSGDKTRLFSRLSDFPSMETLVEQIQNVEKQLQDLKPSICRSLGLLALNYATVSGDEYLIEVKTSLLRAVPSTWTKISGTKTCGRFRSPEVVELYGQLCRLRELLKEAANQSWSQFLSRVAQSYPTLKRANTAIATLDVLISLADVAEAENFVRPKFVERYGVLNVTQGRHPIVSKSVQQHLASSYVPNDTHLDSDDGSRCMILTGPNMGGKSCYLAQVALIAVLAQIGSFVPAVSATLSVFQSIFIRMGFHDEIYAGRSTFMVEMMETAAILANSTSRSLVIVDELGRGTGTHDGSAIACATLEHLINHIKCVTLFVTHYPIVAQIAELYPEKTSCWYMGYLLDSEPLNPSDTETSNTKQEEEALVFLYNLTPGKCPQSFGLNVARLAGIPSDIIGRARVQSDSFHGATNTRWSHVDTFRRIFVTHKE